MPSYSWVKSTVEPSGSSALTRSASGLEHAHGDATVVRVRAEHLVRVVVQALHQAVELDAGDRRRRGVRSRGHRLLLALSVSLAMAETGMVSQPGRLRAS